jgi:hypothetical protein
MKKVFLLVLCATLSFASFAQKNMVQGKPSLQDRFPKTSGNLLFSDLSVSFSRLYDNQKATETIRFYNNGKFPIQIKPVEVAAHLTVVISHTTIAPRQEGTIAITYDAAKRADYGFLIDQLKLETTDSITPMKYFSLATIIEPNIPVLTAADSANAPRMLLSDSIFNYKTVHQGEIIQHPITVTNTGKSDLKILAVKTSCSCIGAHAEKMKLAPGESTIIQATFNSTGKSGKDTHELIIYSNDPFLTKVQMDVTGETIP